MKFFDMFDRFEFFDWIIYFGIVTILGFVLALLIYTIENPGVPIYLDVHTVIIQATPLP